MSRLTITRSELNQRGKSAVNYSADLLEWLVEKGLTVAGISEALPEYGQDYVAKLKDMPEDCCKAVGPGPKKPGRTVVTG